MINESYTMPQEIKSETKVMLWMYALDFFFLIAYGIITSILANVVHQMLQIPFWIFSIAMGVLLTLPSPINKKRRMYQTVIIYLKRNRNVYRPTKVTYTTVKKEKNDV